MYFQNRAQAGMVLAKEVESFKGQDVIVIALTSGGVLVGQSVAAALKARLTMLLTKDIEIPGEGSILGTVDESGGFTYNNMIGTGQIEEYVGEFHNYIEAEKMNDFAQLHQLLGKYGVVERHALRDKVLMLVSDGVSNGLSFDAAMNYLKPVRYKRLVAMAPVATVQAVDRLHILADEIHVLSVTDNFISTNHYFDNNDVPDAEVLLTMLDHINGDDNLAKNNTRAYT